MAKKKPETGPGVFMILALVFFVLTTIVLGVTTYLGFKDADQYEKAAKDAKTEKDTAIKNQAEYRVRLAVDRNAIGIGSDEDQVAISGGGTENAAFIADEKKNITDKLGGNAFPTNNAFKWDEGSTAPNKNVLAITKMWAKIAQDNKAQKDAEATARKKAEANTVAAQDAKDKAEDAFNQRIAALTKEVKDKTDAMQAAFNSLKTEAEKAGANFQKQAADWAAAKGQLEETIQAKNLEIKAKVEENQRLKNPDASDLMTRWNNFNVAKAAERMGTIADKSGDTFVTLNFTKPMGLVPGQTFVVIPPTGSLVEVIEREKALEKHHHEVVSLGPRDPFDGNEMIKGMVEITDVASRYSARARITNQSDRIRNPIGRGDQLFNISLSTGEKEHVAYCGIIDLDGDGRPDNEEFVRILERNNLVIDAYLDLKSGTIKNRAGTDGIDFRTKFLIVGADAPQIGGVAKMMQQAKEKGVQLIDARMFLNLIGVKPPRHPAPPAYTMVNIGGEGEKAPKNQDDNIPMPPPVEKKDEKKDEKK